MGVSKKVTFNLMKAILKIILLTLISCCYLNTVFEFSDREKKTNYENESHTYIQQASQNLNVTYTKAINQLDNVFISWQTEITFSPIDNDALSFAETKTLFPPPERRYILYCSFLI